MATLYVVGTPIGNLEDLSPRAARVLGEVSRILAEDTRRTGVLARHVGATAPLVSLHAHNEAERTAQAVAWLDAGEDLALVSDAGVPLISDPGERLVAAAAEAGHAVAPVPGPSAVTAALTAAGLPAVPFAFLGFVPRKGTDRRRFLERVAGSAETSVLFESPQRLARTLTDLAAACGATRRAVVARELTKLHEEIRRGTLGELAAYYGENMARGEVTLVVDARAEDDGGAEAAGDAARDLAERLLGEGMSPSAAARALAQRLDVPRNTAYRIVLEVAGASDREA